MEAAMEQQQSQQARTARTDRKDLRRTAPERTPERDRLGSVGLTARLALEGAPLWEMPPRNLEELAAAIGNSAMQSLLDAQTPWAEEAGFRMPAEEPDTAPFPVPAGQSLALAEPASLTGMAGPAAAFDPAALAV